MLTSKMCLVFFLVAVLSYLLGSLNSALILSRFVVKDDIRRHGSGSAGMTNILRTYGKKHAVITAAGDFLKCLVAIVVSRLIFRFAGIAFLDAGYFSGLFVMLGHMYPVFFGFRGGKGVVVSLAVVLFTNPLVFLIIAVIFTPLVFITRIVSLCSVLGAVAYPILTYAVMRLQHREALLDTICACIIGVLVLYAHRKNMVRIYKGTENRFGGPKK